MVDYFSSRDGFKERPDQLLNSPGLLQTLVDTNYCYSGSALAQVKLFESVTNFLYIVMKNVVVR